MHESFGHSHCINIIVLTSRLALLLHTCALYNLLLIHNYYSVASGLLKEMQTLLKDKFAVFEGLNQLIVGPRSLYDAAETVAREIGEARRRSRELKLNGMLYSDDYPLEQLCRLSYWSIRYLQCYFSTTITVSILLLLLPCMWCF
jgi:hypothetical protein